MEGLASRVSRVCCLVSAARAVPPSAEARTGVRAPINIRDGPRSSSMDDAFHCLSRAAPRTLREYGLTRNLPVIDAPTAVRGCGPCPWGSHAAPRDALSLRGAVPPHRLETRGGIPYSRRPHPHELTDHQHVRPNREATDELQRMSSTNNLRDWVELEAGPSQGMS